MIDGTVLILPSLVQFVSKRHPEDVKEVEVWRRFSELKKLHGELAYTHRNLFRRQEDFPPFPRAQLFGRMADQPLLFTVTVVITASMSLLSLSP